MPSSLVIERRYRLWQVCVVGQAVLPPAWFYAFVLTHAQRIAVAGAIACGGLAASMTVLILTTPRDAIRLPPQRSARIVTGLTAWLYALEWICFDRTVWGFAAAAVVVFVAARACHVWIRKHSTPWWTAVLLWNPACVGPFAFSLPFVAGAALIACEALNEWTPKRHPLAAP